MKTASFRHFHRESSVNVGNRAHRLASFDYNVGPDDRLPVTVYNLSRYGMRRLSINPPPPAADQQRRRQQKKEPEGPEQKQMKSSIGTTYGQSPVFVNLQNCSYFRSVN